MTGTASAPGLVVAAPASNSGKTTVTLALIRALTRRGLRVATAKVGPDYIDPAFHAAAGGRACVNLDTWAMAPPLLAGLAGGLSQGGTDMILCEGVMGLLDGATGPGDAAHDPGADGSTAALAARLGWPVVLVVDARGMAASAGAVVRGFQAVRPGVTLAGVILTRVGGPRHVETLRAGLRALAPDVRVLGALPRDDRLALPSRHLGLVQAGEHTDLAAFLEGAADLAEAHLDLDALVSLARRGSGAAVSGAPARPLPPPGQRVAVAADEAFAFAYPAVLNGWRGAGAEIVPFSPLADDAPDARADAVYLPGGYPELHAGRLAANARFLDGLRTAAARGTPVFGECGGYMVLGRGLVDAEGTRHALAGLLPVETSFADRRLHLGYRAVATLGPTPFGPAGTAFRGHEFHFARVLAEEGDAQNALFTARDARGRDLGPRGRRAGPVAGSFVHLIAAI
ncbi:cobyrinate a,c-diamide synthase [Roseospira visakhapatnamensis]|uniref:Cobyrinate a,c-diamide synthase n=1 Tax=Roseospira visakhapatnamensis TaxID=390880 RepID=A0A7W6RGS0_9PROT|nr:cobyrinate a,c-diamide synthase [Roseospira visakhapatnamensis]MBB4268050.1 cobyrinic acid a,c-diamide synthase [Roseospira visakhapatnamensis]